MTEAKLKPSVREHFYDEEGYIREGTIQVKRINDCGPYGYQVVYESAEKGVGRHRWEYLGLAEPGLSEGSYAPGTPLVFYQGRKRKLKEKKPVLVGNWGSIRTSSELQTRLDDAVYIKEALE